MTEKKKVRKSSLRPNRKRSGGIRRRSWWPRLLGVVLILALYVGLFYHFFVGPLSFRWRAIYGEPNYPTGFDVMGIDVSHHQADINWDRLRNANIGGHPVNFVFIKGTEGENLTDANFNENFYRAHENDIVRGVYHFYKANRDAKKQARFFLHQVHLVPGDLPPVLDIEERGSKTLREFQKDVLVWLQLVEAEYGVPPIIYTGYKFKVDYLNTQDFDRYPLWIAHYYEKTLRYQGAWSFWQYTDCGRVDGIRGTVDLNIFNGDMRKLMELALSMPSEPTE